MAINREWHEKHHMPKNPTEKEKLEWHIGHAEHCDCRPAPDWVKAAIKKENELKKSHARLSVNH